MDTYSVTREFADSWMLLFLTLFFIGVVVWVFRPGATRTYSDTADIPFRHEDEPAGTEEGASCHKEART